MDDKNFPIVNSIKTTGYHILWQFADDVYGKWNMALRNIFGNWTNFTMYVGDKKQREEFWKARVQKNVSKL